VPHLLLEGNAESYQNFLSSAPKATLVDASEDFYFQIQTIEGPALQLRHVSTYGQATNHGELPEAFMALMLSFRPGSYSRTSPLNETGLLSETDQNSEAPTLHWHFANRSYINHHCNSKVTYLRMESASLLRELCAQAIAVSQLARLQGAAAPASLVQLIEDLSLQFTNADIQQQPQLTEVFFNRLCQELRLLLGPPTASEANAAGHVSLAIEWMLGRLSEPINLQQLADALGLTPRSVQACFKSVLAIAPMRWLKLARISKLRQLLWSGDMKHLSIQQLMGRCGLSENSLNRQCYKEAYGVSPMEERRQAESAKRKQCAIKKESKYCQFDNIESAIQFLKKLNGLDGYTILDHRISIVISSSTAEARGKLNVIQS
jgi:AraC-like DNA-binding protein